VKELLVDGLSDLMTASDTCDISDRLNTVAINVRTMNKMPSIPSMPREIRRADLFGYFQFLMGINVIAYFFLSDITSSVTLEVVGGVAAIGVGLCAIAGAILTWLHPDNMDKGTDPAPGYMLLLAGIGTVALAVVVVLSVATETNVW
jgi:hypothetical protein